MGLFNKLFGKNKTYSKPQEPEHAVIVHFRYEMDSLEPLYQLEDTLEKHINKEGVGEFDGHELAMHNNDNCLYMYGTNAETLFKAVKPILEKSNFMKGAVVKLRFGPPEEGVKELEVKL